MQKPDIVLHSITLLFCHQNINDLPASSTGWNLSQLYPHTLHNRQRNRPAYNRVETIISKQIRMTSSPYLTEYQFLFVTGVYQYPIGADVTFATSPILSFESVIPVLLGKGHTIRKHTNNKFQVRDIGTSSQHPVEITLESVALFDFIQGFRIFLILQT